MTATTQPILTYSTAPTEIKEPVILDYFETFNAGNFEATADLFDAEGVLNAPFEDPIVGQSAIEAYLKAEAREMQLDPQQSATRILEEDSKLEIQVSGRVKTSVFTVNVGWLFVLNSQQKILAVTVKLLASPQELLNLRSHSKFKD
ncbi:MAG: SnoaL-like domain-containing protein [Microcoleus sp. SU_5_6]|nr:SnoaL-like domain-containing protein [Microcoleus sp. SU_5_6]NJL68258.1 SnoaL-like domain-containing protein [Microcoleus sp. SM1_3_4]